jgi:hypothetical protein
MTFEYAVRVASPVGIRAFDLDDLSNHFETFAPDRVTVLESAASYHAAHPGMVRGSNPEYDSTSFPIGAAIDLKEQNSV